MLIPASNLENAKTRIHLYDSELGSSQTRRAFQDNSSLLRVTPGKKALEPQIQQTPIVFDRSPPPYPGFKGPKSCIPLLLFDSELTDPWRQRGALQESQREEGGCGTPWRSL
jgi:hypothetical protein